MFGFRAPERNEISVYAIGFIAWLIVVQKATATPITIDEASTFINFVRTQSFIPWFSLWEANNHVLNSFLTYVSTSVFGDSTFSLRLPNVLSFGLFIAQIARFARCNLKHLPSAIALSIILMFSTIVLDLFSLCRGYGISFALLLLFVNEVLYFIRHPESRLWKAMLSGVLMVSANLNLLPLFAAAVVFIGVLLVTLKSLRKAEIAAWLFAIIGFVWYGFELKSRGLLYLGTDNYIGISLGVTSELFTGLVGLWWLYVPVVLMLLFFGIFNVKALLQWNVVSALYLFFLTAFLAPVAQNLILQSPFPVERTFTHAFLLLMVAFVYQSDRWSIYTSWISVVFSTFFIAGLFLSFSPKRSVLWPNEIIPKGVHQYLDKFQQSQGPPIIMSNYKALSNWEYLSYRENANLTYFEGVENKRTILTADFLFLKKNTDFDFTINAFDTVICEKEADYVLLERSKVAPVKTIDTQPCPQAMDERQEFYNLFESNVTTADTALKTLRITANIELLKYNNELQLVISEESKHGSKRTAFKLNHFIDHRDQESDLPIDIRIPFSQEGETSVLVYFWNVERVKMNIKNCTVALETESVKHNKL